MEGNTKQQKRILTLSTLCCVGLLMALAAAFFIRAPYGFDWTDEPYYAALPYRFILGDRPLVDAWEVHQLSGLLALPVLRLYLLFNGGSTLGVLLYFRRVLILFQLAASLYAFFVVRKRSGYVAGVLFAALLMGYAHYGINGFSYNMMAPLFAVLSALLLFDGMEGKGSAVKVTLSGVFYAFSVMAQPVFAISLPVWIAFWFILGRSNHEVVIKARATLSAAFGKSGVMRPFFCFMLGGVLVIALVLVVVLSKASFHDVLTGMGGMLGDPDHEQTNVLRVLASYVNGVRVLFGPCSYLAAALCVFGGAACFVKDGKRRERLRRMGMWACILLAAGTALWVLTYDYPDYHKINLTAMNLALLGPGLYFLSGKKPDRWMLLYGLGLALSLAVQIGSNTRIRASSGALLPASLAVIPYLFHFGGSLFAGRTARRFTALAALSLACSVALMAGLRLTTVYRDEPLDALDTVIISGPAAGIVTTEERGAQYEQLYADITHNAPESGRLLITNLMPVGYLMTALPPGTPSVFNMTLDAAWLAAYETALPENSPSFVFAVYEEVGQSNDIALSGAEALTPANGWTSRRLPSGTAYYYGED